MRSVATLICLAWLPLAGCDQPTPPPVEQLPSGSDAEARRVVISFYTAYVAGDVDAALTHLCERSASQQARAREFIGRSQAAESPYRIERFDVGNAEPTWAEGAPMYLVDVRFPGTRSPNGPGHKHRVRARDACIERFLPSQSAPADPVETDPPRAAPRLEAPTDEGDDVVNL